jgi:hypothetical protein
VFIYPKTSYQHVLIYPKTSYQPVFTNSSNSSQSMNSTFVSDALGSMFVLVLIPNTGLVTYPCSWTTWNRLKLRLAVVSIPTLYASGPGFMSRPEDLFTNCRVLWFLSVPPWGCWGNIWSQCGPTLCDSRANLYNAANMAGCKQNTKIMER